MKESGSKPSTSTLNILINEYAKVDGAIESTKLLELMSQEENIQPNDRTYNHLVKAWCNRKNIKEARNVVYKMLASSGIYPNVVMYNTIARAYAEVAKTYKAEQMIFEMQTNKVAPNECACGIIVSGYSKEGNTTDALRFVYRMKELGL
ncbi:hypothetical protein SLEP1_g22976 [Rubroshorea leprosula]|uniref:Pentatricopeptide repeat-containing protein n=1 Tax=Rubroshorea leprosula TaxID=152421 RepID=A0AAV5JKD8_9ROSI|nr:hypothetical protein SLEP1_g22976 [Rubroshorea leprosula]